MSGFSGFEASRVRGRKPDADVAASETSAHAASRQASAVHTLRARPKTSRHPTTVRPHRATYLEAERGFRGASGAQPPSARPTQASHPPRSPQTTPPAAPSTRAADERVGDGPSASETDEPALRAPRARSRPHPSRTRCDWRHELFARRAPGCGLGCRREPAGRTSPLAASWVDRPRRRPGPPCCPPSASCVEPVQPRRRPWRQLRWIRRNAFGFGVGCGRRGGRSRSPSSR